MATAEPATRALPELNKVHHGDALALMRRWPDAFVDCTVTSVPYFWHRQYLDRASPLAPLEMGCEKTIADYLADMVRVFYEVHRITRDGGTLFLNVGDKHCTQDMKRHMPGLRVGELPGIPWRLAFALREIGWYLVEEIIWASNKIPESSPRRPSRNHEQVFLLAKGPSHYFDREAIKTPAAYRSQRPGGTKAGARRVNQQGEDQGYRSLADTPVPEFSMPRTVWEIGNYSLQGRKILADFKEGGRHWIRDPRCPFHGAEPVGSAGPLFGKEPDGLACCCKESKGDFFAAMPPELAWRCIAAGTSEKNCAACGRPWTRVVEKERVPTRPGEDTKAPAKEDQEARRLETGHRDPHRHVSVSRTLFWEPSCACPADTGTVNPIVFDPFTGSGTTPMVAASLGRRYLGTELNPRQAKHLAPLRIRRGWARS